MIYLLPQENIHCEPEEHQESGKEPCFQMKQGIYSAGGRGPQRKPPEGIARTAPKTSTWAEKIKHQRTGHDGHHLQKESQIGMEVVLEHRPLPPKIEVGSCAGEPVGRIVSQRI